MVNSYQRSSEQDLRGDYHNPLPAKLVQKQKINHRRLAVLEWVRTRVSSNESESTMPESQSQSESIRPESESIGPESESESESIRPESESSGSESESESASPTEDRVSPDLSPDSAWTHESNNRKVLYFNPTFW